MREKVGEKVRRFEANARREQAKRGQGRLAGTEMEVEEGFEGQAGKE